MEACGINAGILKRGLCLKCSNIDLQRTEEDNRALFIYYAKATLKMSSLEEAHKVLDEIAAEEVVDA